MSNTITANNDQPLTAGFYFYLEEIDGALSGPYPPHEARRVKSNEQKVIYIRKGDVLNEDFWAAATGYHIVSNVNGKIVAGPFDEENKARKKLKAAQSVVFLKKQEKSEEVVAQEAGYYIVEVATDEIKSGPYRTLPEAGKHVVPGLKCKFIDPGAAPKMPHLRSTKEAARKAVECGLPPYVSQNGEVEHFELALRCAHNVLLVGPKGCGKTHLIAWVAAQQNRAVITIQGGEGATQEHIVGYRDVEEKNGASVTVWRDGLLTMAMRSGAILYVDEPNALPDGIRFYLHSAMDDRREVTLAENRGECLKAKDGFVVVGAMNEGDGYGGTTLLNEAFRDRWDTIIDLGYLNAKREADVIRSRTSVSVADAEKLAEAADKLRKMHGARQVKTNISTRALLACAEMMNEGLTPREAAKLTVIAKVPAMATTERKAFEDTFAALFVA